MEEEWLCQKGGHVCTGVSTWVDRGSPLGQLLFCHGNVCAWCLNGNVVVEVTCRMCQKPHNVSIWPPGYVDWKDGMCIQDALPPLSASDRELLISGTCSKCFDDMFKEAP